MKRIRTLYLLFLIIFATQISGVRSQVAVKGEKVHTMAGEVLHNGVVLIKENKIERVGSAFEIDIPEEYEVIEGRVVTPGLIDVRSVVGLAGIYNQKHDQDQLETSDPIQPELRAFDAFNPNEELISWLSSFGVTTINTGHAPGGLSSGQTMIIKTDGGFEKSIVRKTSAIVFSLGTEVSSQFKSPGTRPKGMAMLRTAFTEAQNYQRKRDAGEAPKNLKYDALVSVLNKEVPAVITANTTIDILGALRLAEEFGFDLILDGAAEVYMVIDQVKEANIPIFLHAQMARTKNATFITAKRLKDEGIPFAIQSGYESYVPKTRNILFEAAVAVGNGLSFEDGLEAITISPAKILKIDDRVGSLEKGKDADIVVFDGDPFEYTSHVCQVIIDGVVIKSECN